MQSRLIYQDTFFFKAMKKMYVNKEAYDEAYTIFWDQDLDEESAAYICQEACHSLLLNTKYMDKRIDKKKFHEMMKEFVNNVLKEAKK